LLRHAVPSHGNLLPLMDVLSVPFAFTPHPTDGVAQKSRPA
jgi:hypothetical protein